MNRVAAAVVVGLLVALTACGGSSGSDPSKVPEVVSGSTWTGVTVTAGAASADVAADVRKDLTPLLATRRLDRPSSLVEYGLDHPQAQLSYKGGGGTADVDVGQLNFDRHFVYVQRRGRPAVYLVPADTLRPVLALVGIDLKPPE